LSQYGVNIFHLCCPLQNVVLIFRLTGFDNTIE
jgi:hypothetical protein